jgi:acyl carrier protein
MSKKTVVEIVTEHIGETKAKEKDLTIETSFADAGLDSLDAVELIMKVEEEYGLEISETEATALKTVGDLQTCVTNKLNNQANPA